MKMLRTHLYTFGNSWGLCPPQLKLGPKKSSCTYLLAALQMYCLDLKKKNVPDLDYENVS